MRARRMKASERAKKFGCKKHDWNFDKQLGGAKITRTNQRGIQTFFTCANCGAKGRATWQGEIKTSWR